MPTAEQSVVDALQASVALHLTAVEHYATLAEHLDRWGYSKLGEKYRADADEERGHLKSCVDRLEFYDVAPVLTHPAPSWPRHDYAGILEANLTLERTAATVERSNVVATRAVGDELSALVFADLLSGSEESIQEIEAAQTVIGQIGLDNYLANQV
mgnify:CR=1 FL=1